MPVDIELPTVSSGPLLVSVEGFEVDFESSVLSERGEPLSVARLRHIRQGPVFHVIEGRPEDQPGDQPLKVVVRPGQLTRNARITARLFELPVESRRDAARIEAYKTLEAATQSTADESAELWRERAAMLQSAAAGLARAGAVEAQLWAEYLAGYAHYFPLAEYGQAAAIAKALRPRAREYGYPEIELMAAQLEGQVLIERDDGDTPDQARDKAERAQIVLQFASDLAAQLGYRFEQAWALNSRGIGYFYQDRYDKAEQKYQQALEIALGLRDSAFQNQVRGNLALVRERQGDLFGALAELREINALLSESGSDADLAHNWSELSRLYERLYLFPESIDAQSQALALWRQLNSAEGRGRSGLSLAHAYHAIGKTGAAVPLLIDAIGQMKSAGFARGLRDGYGLLADLYRSLGEHERMAAARERQEEFLSSDRQQAGHLYKKGLDALAQFPGEPARADRLFATAEMAASGVGDRGLELRAWLQRCALALDRTNSCASPELPAAVESWLPTAPPRQALEARYLLARNLDKLGQQDEAWALLERLVDELQFYRDSLPGVLGAWYWEGRTRIFEEYMELALRNSAEPSTRARRSLLAFNRLVNTSLGLPAAAGGEDTAETLADLRSLLAGLERAGPERAPDIHQAIDRRLLDLQMAATRPDMGFTDAGLQAALQGLPAGSALVAYYLAPGGAWAWLGDNEGLRLLSLESGPAIDEVLQRIRSGLRVVGNSRLDENLARAGTLLIRPLSVELPESVYLLAAGELAGFPFEAITVGGRPLGQDHTVINILSLQALARLAQPREAEPWHSVVLAGDPLTQVGGLPELPSARLELDGIAGVLADRELWSARGEQLGPELFGEPAFGQADVIHIASHARIDLEYPELSRLMVSGEEGERYLTPLDLRGRNISADLVVLSACETTGVNAWSFDSNLGFVSAFLDSGARAVVASLWPVADAFAADFMLAFYEAMIAGADAPAALASAKRLFMAGPPSGQIPDWPAFQIYIN